MSTALNHAEAVASFLLCPIKDNDRLLDEDNDEYIEASSSAKVKDEPADIAELERDPRYRRIQQRRHRADDSDNDEDDR